MISALLFRKSSQRPSSPQRPLPKVVQTQEAQVEDAQNRWGSDIGRQDSVLATTTTTTTALSSNMNESPYSDRLAADSPMLSPSLKRDGSQSSASLNSQQKSRPPKPGSNSLTDASMFHMDEQRLNQVLEEMLVRFQI